MSNLWQCIIADLKQRTRQQSYKVTLLTMAVLTLMFFPAPDAQYQTLIINGYRGIYNGAWIGVCLAMLNVMFLPLICFYLIKNALDLDRSSLTSELIAATPVSKHTIILAKWCTNVLILLSIILVMLLSSLIIQLFYGESYQIDIWHLVWPQLVFVVPVLLAVASIALMFECIKWFRGGLGNVVYFFLWIGSIVKTIESVSGVGALMEEIDQEIATKFPMADGGTNVGVNLNPNPGAVNTFVWQGTDVTSTHLVGALPMVFISVICLLVAYVCFDRYSQSHHKEESSDSKASKFFDEKLLSPFDRLFQTITSQFAFTRLLRLELKLLLKGHSLTWLIGLFTINIVQLVVPQDLLLNIFLPLAWLWCVLVISQLGQLEKSANTFEIANYGKQSIIQQNMASYLAACLLLGLASFGGLLKIISAGDWLLLVQLLIAIAFSVSLAYLCGSITGNKRMFEVVYPTLWYAGPLNATLYLDFFGVNSAASWQAGTPIAFATLAIILLALAVTKNQRALT